MLRIAVPNKGSLAEGAARLLAEAGYRGRHDPKDLLVIDHDNDAELFFLRPKDIATYVGAGRLDVGITGRDMLVESGASAVEVLPLGFARSSFRYAGREDDRRPPAERLAGARVATSFPGLVQADLDRAGITATTVRLDGAVEVAIRLGVADVVADVVQTGTTLRNAGLAVFGEPILASEAVLVRPAGAGPDPAVDVLVQRCQGVVVAQQFVLLDYDVTEEQLEAACALTPGFESPTISPLHHPGWFAVRAMVPRKDHNRVMDGLLALGARGILVTTIHACRL